MPNTCIIKVFTPVYHIQPKLRLNQRKKYTIKMAAFCVLPETKQENVILIYNGFSIHLIPFHLFFLSLTHLLFFCVTLANKLRSRFVCLVLFQSLLLLVLLYIFINCIQRETFISIFAHYTLDRYINQHLQFAPHNTPIRITSKHTHTHTAQTKKTTRKSTLTIYNSYTAANSYNNIETIQKQQQQRI